LEETVLRRGRHWTRDDQGRWLCWDPETNTWTPSDSPPPPPLSEDDPQAGDRLKVLLLALVLAAATGVVLDMFVHLVGYGDTFAQTVLGAPFVLTGKFQKAIALTFKKPELADRPSLTAEAPHVFTWLYMGLLCGAVLVGATQVSAFAGAIIGGLVFGNQEQAIASGVSVGIFAQLVGVAFIGRWIAVYSAPPRWAALTLALLVARLLGAVVDFALIPGDLYRQFFGTEKDLGTYLRLLITVPSLVLLGTLTVIAFVSMVITMRRRDSGRMQ
jgi:hypothetical protein